MTENLDEQRYTGTLMENLHKIAETSQSSVDYYILEDSHGNRAGSVQEMMSRDVWQANVEMRAGGSDFRWVRVLR